MTETAPQPASPTTIDELKALIDQELGPTDWLEVTQERIDAFADATGDHQWIHVDPERAAKGPFGTTIAHGLLTLSLGPAFSAKLIGFGSFAHALNYGYNKVRFPAPVPVGSRLRMRATVKSVTETPNGYQVTTAQVLEREGSPKPVLAAESVAVVAEGASA
ncbi:MaoC family dehydratase [Antrihabitans cavernicola]|uniref:MaoC family dehydratase n=1 Tax=Antrihabitans cavernicola TaxID=2495913 RepID=A0A5A7S6I3_9NOCA|nr:MaoC family dehydratase [Spelaeibacter cavernicola]KAA0021758.1 MaoC family dehydratase [Spelaeibacter cavernicola]